MRIYLNVMRAKALRNDWEGFQALLSSPGRIVLSNGDRSLSRDTLRAYQMLFRAFLTHGFHLDSRPFTMHCYSRAAEVIISALSKSVLEHDGNSGLQSKPGTDRTSQLIEHVASCLVSGGFDQKRVSNMMLSAGLSKRHVFSAPAFGKLVEDRLYEDLGI